MAREIINHRSLCHPNIIRFKEVTALKTEKSHLASALCGGLKAFWILQVVLTPTHIAIVMEYAAGGELFDRICSAGRFSEDEVKIKSPIFLKINFRIYRQRRYVIYFVAVSLIICDIHYFFLSGKILFPAAYIRSQLLPCYGNESDFQKLFFISPVVTLFFLNCHRIYATEI